MRYIGVIDIGKTNAKLAIVDARTFSEVAVLTAPNRVIDTHPYPHFDIETIWTFLKGSIVELNVQYPLDALSITTHGASAALVDAEGNLTLPVLDYESPAPDIHAAEYNKARPPFKESFTPRLPGGLNLGAQLFYLEREFPDAFARTQWILTYPQYWAFRLTGVAASELTSIGCHTDLWNFQRGDFSSLVDKRHWRGKLPPIRMASETLGTLSATLAAELGLHAPIPVACGIHDSNASLVPHLLSSEPPASIVSTGTWVIACSPGASLAGLDPQRDCLANIDAFGRPVPSARFMGGREFSLLIPEPMDAPDPAIISGVMARNISLFPSIQPGSGPFPERVAQWSCDETTLTPEERYATVSFYLALVTAECLAMTGGSGNIAVEGPFSHNPLYCAMLASAMKSVVSTTSNSTGTSIGAALLAATGGQKAELKVATKTYAPTSEMRRYAKMWRERLASGTQ